MLHAHSAGARAGGGIAAAGTRVTAFTAQRCPSATLSQGGGEERPDGVDRVPVQGTAAREHAAAAAAATGRTSKRAHAHPLPHPRARAGRRSRAPRPGLAKPEVARGARRPREPAGGGVVETRLV